MHAYQVSNYPLDDDGFTSVPAGTAGFTCTTNGADGAAVTALGCNVTLAHGAQPQPELRQVDVTVALQSFSASAVILVFHPLLQLSTDAAELRRLSPATGCATPVFESADIEATATFQHPDDATDLLVINVNDVVDFTAVPTAAVSVQGGRVVAQAAALNATIALSAAANVNPTTSSVQLSVLDEDSCVDRLLPVATSVSRITLTSISPTYVQVQVEVQQFFSDPGDLGEVTVYAQQGFRYTDVTDQVWCCVYRLSRRLTVQFSVLDMFLGWVCRVRTTMQAAGYR